MRSLVLLAAACLAIGAILGAGSAHATPTKYPPCNEYGNAFGVPELAFDTVRGRAYVLSGSSIHVLVCGAAPDPQPPFDCGRGIDTMNDNVYVDYAPGTRVTATDDNVVPENSYAGTSDGWFVGVAVCDGYITTDGEQTLRTIDPDNVEAKPECADDATGEVTACYKIDTDSVSLGYMAIRRVLREGSEGLRLELKRPRADSGLYAIAETAIGFCNYFGQPQVSRCGTSGTPTAFNGAPSAPGCAGDAGIFRARVHRPLNGGEWSGDTLTCVPWLDSGNTDFRSAHGR